MKIYTPQISWHDRQPILSVDIQNRLHSKIGLVNNYRLATGGNDSHVIIWKVAVNDEHQDEQSINKKPIDLIECLSELTQHQRSVNVVRFSPNVEDNFLASGDDDSLIFIWKLFDDEPSQSKNNKTDEKNSATVEKNDFESDAISIETWKTYKILRGHNQDVSDLCWSKDGQHLVSGSVDNNVFVWDVHRGVKFHKVVKEHSSYVQGVTWDPLNKYIASLSADRNMIIFNSKNGKTLHRIFKINFEENSKFQSSKLFYDQTMMSFFRRLTFSPGGELLFAPSGILEIGNDKFENVVHVFERKSLNRPSFYLPTNKFSIAVKCCPIMFQLRQKDENVFKIPYRIVFAVATQDSVLFYDSQQLFPFAYVSQLHYLRLTDISWSPDGRILIITSTDGFSSFVTFNENELGIPYQGELLNFEDLEISLSSKTPNKSNSNNTNNNGHNVNKSVPVEKEQKTKPTITSSPQITTFFKKTSQIIEANNLNNINKNFASCNNQPKVGRRVSLITLYNPNKTRSEENIIADDNKQYETGIKRKQSENGDEMP